MSTPQAEDWHKYIKDVARNPAKAHPRLFAPLLMACSAQIEAISVADMVNDGTRIRKNLSSLARMLPLSALACTTPSALEVEALGATLDYQQWPPVIASAAPLGTLAGDVDIQNRVRSQRLGASLDAVRQLVAGDAQGPLLLAALTGPATLAGQLRHGNPDSSREGLYGLAGQVLAYLARQYAEAGINVLQLHEAAPPADEVSSWKDALRTVGNMARFHRVPCVVIFDTSAPASGVAPLLAACPGGDSSAPGTEPAPYGMTWPSSPDSWPTTLPEGPRLITTAGDAPDTFDLSRLAGIMHALQAD